MNVPRVEESSKGGLKQAGGTQSTVFIRGGIGEKYTEGHSGPLMRAGLTVDNANAMINAISQTEWKGNKNYNPCTEYADVFKGLALLANRQDLIFSVCTPPPCS